MLTLSCKLSEIHLLEKKYGLDQYRFEVTPEQSKLVQEQLFIHCIASWLASSTVDHLQAPNLYVDPSLSGVGHLSFSNRIEGTWDDEYSLINVDYEGRLHNYDMAGGYEDVIDNFYVDTFYKYIFNSRTIPANFDGWYLWNITGNLFARDSISTDDSLTKDNGTYIPDTVPEELKEAIQSWLALYGEEL